MTVPGYCSRNFSSQATDSASRWLVGSSSSSMSGSDSSRRHSATRRFSPPDSLFDLRIPVGQAQGIAGDLELALEFPAVFGVDGVLQLGLLVEQLVHLVVVESARRTSR
jgi:hypothetical protein